MNCLRRFSSLIAPVEVPVFAETYFERRPLHVPRTDPEHFAGVLHAGDLDRLFQCKALTPSVIRLAKGGQELHPDRYCARTSSDRQGDRVLMDRVLTLFGEGYTVIVNAGNVVFQPLDRFAHDLERELGFRVQPNIYITPFDAQGFATHYDDHDVFILQVMGSKRWRLFHAPVELPSPMQRYVAGTHTVGPPEMEVTLHSGDSLYIPRGVLHDAVTGGETSAHVTLGLQPITRYQLVQELARVAEELPAFRHSLPLAFLDGTGGAEEGFRRMLLDLAARTDVRALIERRHASFLQELDLDAPSRFSDLARLNRLTAKTVVRRRPNVLHVIERSDKSITVCFAGQRIAVQPFLESALDQILGEAPFASRDIDAFVGEQARVELVRRFVAAGLLEIMDFSE